MDALERVALREGLGGLSIDAVAKEAGISKSSVVYDCGCKAGLLASFTRRRLDQFKEVFDEHLQTHEDEPNPWLRAMIDVAREAPSEDDILSTMLISASMGQDAECRELVRDAVSRDVARITDEAEDKNRMLKLFLALHGLWMLECFGLQRFDPATRDELLDGLQKALETDKGSPGAIPAPPQT